MPVETQGGLPPNEATSRASRDRLERVVTWILLIAGTALIAFRLGHLDLWMDEFGTSWAVATSSPVEVIRRVLAVQGQSPLYYLLVWVVTQVTGDTAWGLRLVSALAGVASLPGFYLLGKRLFNTRRAGHLVLAYVIVNVHFLRFSQDARPYMLGLLLTCWSMYALLRAMEEGSWRWHVTYGLCAVGVLYSHYMFLWIPLCQVCFLLTRGYWRKPVCVRWWWTAGGMLICVLPLIPQVLDIFQRRGELNFMPPFSAPIPLLIVNDLVGVEVLAITMVLAALWYFHGTHAGKTVPAVVSKDCTILAWWVLLPVGGLGLVSILTGYSFFIPRYVSEIAPGLWLLAGGLLALMVTSWRQHLVMLALIAGASAMLQLVPNLQRYGTLQNRTPAGWEAATAEINQHGQNGDVVLAAVMFIESKSLNGPDQSQEIVNFVRWPAKRGLDASKGFDLQLVPCPLGPDNASSAREAIKTAEQASSVWLVGHEDTCNLLADGLARHQGFRLETRHTYNIATVIHLTQDAPTKPDKAAPSGEELP